MEVLLYIYDLSQGLARQMSMQFLGIQIDAVYHTSIVLNNTEYFFGSGIQMCQAGRSHHGRPMEVVRLGQTDLPPDVIEDYLGALRETYTAESYDLFMHNCNNFSHDFAQFLVGKGIPDRITNLPRQVLNTPFGRMLQPQLDASMRSVTQAPVPAHAVPNVTRSNGTQQRPNHAHDRLPLEVLRKDASDYITYKKTPDLEKLLAANTDITADAVLTEALTFVTRRSKEPVADIPLPDLTGLRDSLLDKIPTASPETQTALVEIARLILLDVRVSTFFAEEESTKHTIGKILQQINARDDARDEERLIDLHLAFNLFTSPQLRRATLRNKLLVTQLVELTTTNLLDQDKPKLRLSASAVALNFCTAHFQNQLSSERSSEAFNENQQVEVAVALIEVLSADTAAGACIRNVAIALGRLLFRAAPDGELREICGSLEATARLRERCDTLPAQEQGLVEEVAQLLET